MDTDALRFRAAQCKTCVTDLNQDRIGADGTARDDFDRFAFDETEFAQAPGDGIVTVEAAYRIDDGWRKGREIGKIHNIFKYK